MHMTRIQLRTLMSVCNAIKLLYIQAGNLAEQADLINLERLFQLLLKFGSSYIMLVVLWSL